jgi:glycosyltransferase involved in cell wall biosynthesis
MRLSESIAYEVGIRLLGRHHHLGTATLQARTTAAVATQFLRSSTPVAAPTGLFESPTTELCPRLPPDVSISVVVTTRDCPDDLRDCLRHLMGQDTPRAMEIVVVDRNAASGLTPPVVAEFPGVKLLRESRRGRMRARNLGFAASQGEIIVSIGDFVAAPPDWLEKLLAPLVDSSVTIVTGNNLAKQLETGAQVLFDRHVRLRCGFEPRRVDEAWLRSFRRRAAPCWELGTLTNAAFRAQILDHPAIGLTGESLGSVVATGGSDDAYFFYRALKFGRVLVYQPAAYAWYRPEREMSALRRFVYAEGKSLVAYQLTTLVRDRDLRAIPQVAFYLPRKQIWNGLRHLKRLLAGRSDYSVRLMLVEIAGNIAGPWSLLRSWRETR